LSPNGLEVLQATKFVNVKGGIQIYKYKVIFHVDENNKFKLALNNIKNLLEDMKNSYLEVEILVNSEAVSLVKKECEYTINIEKLMKKKVSFVVCNNSLKALKIKGKELIDGVVIVDSGVGELVKKQIDGWAYIKP